jgi:formiminotetrahydrofolate cyclodeaminase
LLASTDALVFEEALGALRGVEGEGRDAALRDTLVRASEVLMLISHAACDVALLAAEVSEKGDPELSADAAVAALLAEAATKAARHLVAVNLTMVPDDERAARGDQLVTSAASAAKRALGAA